LAEGRKAFLDRVAGIEAGAECDRLAPLLSRLADGEATAEDMAGLRPHMRSCLSCRAALREYRGAPSRVAALLPVLAAPHLLGRLIYRVQLLVSRVHDSLLHAGELAGGQKAAAVAAATAALAGGGAATVTSLEHHRAALPARARATHERAPRPKATTTVAVKPPVGGRTATSSSGVGKRTSTAKAGAMPEPTRSKTVAAAQHEFTPSPVSGAPTRPRGTRPATSVAGGEFGP
jgi:hypothetical protein